MYDLRSFGLADLLECSSQLRRVGTDASSLEEAAQAVVEFLFDNLIDKETDQPALALARLYKTHRLDELEPDLQEFARDRAGADLAGETPCLTLLGSAGVDAAWNDRRRSRDHKALPLHDNDAVASAPMVYELTRQLGFDERVVLQPDPALFHTMAGRAGGVFFVDDAAGSPHIPAQHEFVERYGIRSVVGFGGILPSGYVYAVILFATVPLDAAVAETFAPLAFATQLVLLPFVENRLFASDPNGRPNSGRELRQAQAEATALSYLLEARQQVVVEQAMRLEQARRDAEDRADALARSQAKLEASEATKAAILDAALDAIITIDINGRIVDFNPAAETIFGHPRSSVIGQQLAELIIPPELRDAHRAGMARYSSTGEGPILGQRVEVTAMRCDGSTFPAELAVASIDAAGTSLFSGHIRDISQRVSAEHALRAASDRYADIARILQSSLLPPDLPDVPRYDVASRYRPGQYGLDVGGDFYDVFRLGETSWGAVLGDVMGKGAEAAATTALARHTVRAAALGADDPVEVLRVLNQALYRDDPDRFCTAVTAFLADDGGVRFGAGGHPPALIRRASGRVEEVRTEGGILGPFPDWDGAEALVQLEAGDLVLLYSDGVVEARRSHEEFGSERLANVLAAGPADANAALDGILAALDDFSTNEPDDVSLVAVRYTS